LEEEPAEPLFTVYLAVSELVALGGGLGTENKQTDRNEVSVL